MDFSTTLCKTFYVSDVEGCGMGGCGVVAVETFVLNVKYVFREAFDNDIID